MRLEGRKGTPIPVRYAGLYHASVAAFARAYGLDPRLVYERLQNDIRDERLIEKRLTRSKRPVPPDQGRSPMYVGTSFGVWKV